MKPPQIAFTTDGGAPRRSPRALALGLVCAAILGLTAAQLAWQLQAARALRPALVQASAPQSVRSGALSDPPGEAWSGARSDALTDALSNEQQATFQTLRQRLDFPWERLLGALERELPAPLAALHFEHMLPRRAATLSLAAGSAAEVFAATERLARDPLFEAVNLVRQEAAAGEGGPTRFTLELRLRTPGAPQPHGADDDSARPGEGAAR